MKYFSFSKADVPARQRRCRKVSSPCDGSDCRRVRTPFDSSLLFASTIIILTAFITVPLLARQREAGPVRTKDPGYQIDVGKKSLMVHDVGNVRMTLSNWGEQGNPDATPGYYGFEFPGGSENDFLFSSGIWVGAIVNGQKLVSTGTDGDNGTNEFAPTLPIGQYPSGYLSLSKQSASIAGRPYVMGAKEIDDDGDWNRNGLDDLDGNGSPSTNWDGGKGIIGKDDDGDGGEPDEEYADGIDNDNDGLIDEDTDDTGDDNGDGNCNYDPETHIDEDPAGDISNDFIDNDFNGLVDMDDPDADGDAVPGSLDDDGDGQFDEDGVARGTQEYFTVYDDRDRSQVQSPDNDGHTPLNLMVLQKTYAWGEAYAGEFILVDLIVRNVGQLPLTEVYLGLFADPDVAAKGESGDPASLDDWNLYDEENLMMIQGDDTTDADGFGPGLFAMKVVRTPAPLDSLNIAFKNFNRSTGGDPATNGEKYNMISAPPAENSPSTATQDDWRFLMGFGPKSGGWLLLPGDELPVTVAFIAGKNLAEVRKNAQWAQRIYDNDFRGPAAPDQPVFWAEPSPERIRIFWKDNSEASIDPISQLADFEGYQLQRSSDANRWSTLAQWDVIDAFPYPEFERENFNLGMPYDTARIAATNPELFANSGWMWSVSASGDSSRIYWYDDNNVIPGWTYHYIVRAFDQGIPGAGTLITPIGRNALTVRAGDTEGTPGTSAGGNLVDGVYVVPNPYKGGHIQEKGGAVNEANTKIYPRQLFFYGLPRNSRADIDIYTLSGDHIITLPYEPGQELSNQLMWDMRNQYKQEIVSGVYYYIVKAGGQQKIDKFVVLK